MLNLIRFELFKIFKKWRTYIGFIAIGLMVPIIQIALLYTGEGSINFMTRSLQQSFLFTGNLLNTYFISYMVLNSLTVHIPFLITLVAGDLLAGEATAGTYRMLVTRPVSRFKILTSKFIAGNIYTNLLVLWLAVISLGLGYLLFGTGELIVVNQDGIIIFASSDVMWRFLLSYGFAALSMMLVSSLSFLFSALVENAIGPIVTTMAIIIIFIILTAIDIDFFRTIKPYLFTSYMGTWRLMFDDPLDTAEIIKSALVLSGHILGFYGLSYLFFKRKDILS